MATQTIQIPVLHPMLLNLVERELAAGRALHPEDVFPALQASNDQQRSALLMGVSEAFNDVDRELDQAMRALDQSMEEQVGMNRELLARAERLEGALGAKEEALQQLSRAKIQLLNQEKLASIGTLASGIAHEINTPTQFVSDNLSFLKDAFSSLGRILHAVAGTQGATDPAEALESIRKVAGDCDMAFYQEEVPLALAQSLEGMERVAHIVRSMKEFSHPGKGGKRAVDLNRNVLSTLTVCRNEWKYVAEMVTELADDLAPVPCAPEEVNQVVLNLVVNAAHAIQDAKRSKGIITVKTCKQDGGVEISIADNGCGIPEAIQARIFDPFFTTKEVGRGTGQGLALAHLLIVEKHQGKIGFESRPGEGTTFRLWLPLTGSLT